MKFISHLIDYVALTSIKKGIDPSHGVPHSLDVICKASDIFTNVKWLYPSIIPHERIVLTSACIHDMCDRKYMDESEGLENIDLFLQNKLEFDEISAVKQIITTMSYSKVKKNGYPFLGKYQMAYHIVREADLLAAYNFERAIQYHMHKTDGDLLQSYENACGIFYSRILKHNDDNLFITDYSKMQSVRLHDNALKQMDIWKHIISKL